jgi:electron transfer flavoprotein alpha subunit
VASILVFIETRADEPTAASLGLLGAGRRLAASLGATLYAAIADTSDTTAAVRVSWARALGNAGADKVVLVPAAHAAPPLWDWVGAGLTDTCRALRPQLVLFGAGLVGSELGARLANRLDALYLSGCTFEDDGGLIQDEGPTGAQRLSAGELPALAVISAVGIPPLARGGAEIAELLVLPHEPPVAPVITASSPASTAHHPGGGRTVFVVGSGLPTSQLPLVEDCARMLDAEVLATATACARGVMAPARQLTAARVAHVELYVVVGAAGSPEHLASLPQAAIIVVINPDAEAPLWRRATYGLAQPAEVAVPALLAALRARPEGAS